jgi:hypothetical protein
LKGQGHRWQTTYRLFRRHLKLTDLTGLSAQANAEQRRSGQENNDYYPVTAGHELVMNRDMTGGHDRFFEGSMEAHIREPHWMTAYDTLSGHCR